jgi:hypothetical protein
VSQENTLRFAGFIRRGFDVIFAASFREPKWDPTGTVSGVDIQLLYAILRDATRPSITKCMPALDYIATNFILLFCNAWKALDNICPEFLSAQNLYYDSAIESFTSGNLLPRSFWFRDSMRVSLPPRNAKAR